MKLRSCDMPNIFIMSTHSVRNVFLNRYEKHSRWHNHHIFPLTNFSVFKSSTIYFYFLLKYQHWNKNSISMGAISSFLLPYPKLFWQGYSEWEKNLNFNVFKKCGVFLPKNQCLVQNTYVSLWMFCKRNHPTFQESLHHQH